MVWKVVRKTHWQMLWSGLPPCLRLTFFYLGHSREKNSSQVHSLVKWCVHLKTWAAEYIWPCFILQMHVLRFELCLILSSLCSSWKNVTECKKRGVCNIIASFIPTLRHNPSLRFVQWFIVYLNDILFLEMASWWTLFHKWQGTWYGSIGIVRLGNITNPRAWQAWTRYSWFW